MEIIDQSIISEFMEWKRANQDTFTWWSYVNMKTDIQVALGLASFFCPEIIVKDNCLLLKDHFNEKIYDGWKEQLKGDKTKIEKVMNHYEVRDFFHINTDFNDQHIDEQIEALAKAIQFYWSLSLKRNYPNIDIVVKIFEEYDTTCVTVFENINN